MIDDYGIGDGFVDWIGCWMYIWGFAGSGLEEACMHNTPFALRLLAGIFELFSFQLDSSKHILLSIRWTIR